MKSKSFKLIALVALLFAVNANAQFDHGNNDDIGLIGGQGRPYQVERQILCESNSHKPAACSTGLNRVRSIYLARQISKASCIEGSTYNFYGDRINVRDGCRGYFVARGVTHNPLPSDNIIGGGGHNGVGGWNGDGGHNGGGGWNGDGGHNEMVTLSIRCESNNNNPAACSIPLRRVREAYLSQQHSKAACIQGSSYRILNTRIEVNQGCRATFTVRGYR